MKVENEITGDEQLEEESFFYEIQASEDDSPLPDNLDVTIVGAGSATFENFVFNKTGAYGYQIYQLSGENDDYDYDQTVYDVTVYISNDGNDGLESTIHVMKSGTQLKSAEITFTNAYQDPDDGSGDSSDDSSDDGDSDSEDDSTGEGAQTGDTTNINPILLLMLGSLTVLVMLLDKKREEIGVEVLEQDSTDVL